MNENGIEAVRGNGRSILTPYMPWLLLLLAVDGFGALLLWLADAAAFRALTAVLLLMTLLLFGAVCGVLIYRGRGRERAFCSFLETPDEYHEEQLARRVSAREADLVRLLGRTLREKEEACGQARAHLGEYEEYVEAWAHETKTPLSLLTLLLDNRREELPPGVSVKLDYIRSRMQEFIDQMLFYARLKGARKDYLFEDLELEDCIEEVLEDYRPLLEEKRFQVTVRGKEGPVYTDRRGLRFLLGQAVSNAVKYSQREPRLCFEVTREGRCLVLAIRDNGAGTRPCDLPYIFEKGFTGDSGDSRKKATGMGLYLAKEMGKDLNLSLEARSRWGEGFELRIHFPVVSSPGRRL